MSEYGPPCVDDSENNVTPNKYYYKLLQSEYYQGCTTEIEGITISTEYRSVNNSEYVTEYTIFKQNNGILDLLDSLPYFDTSVLKNYHYSLYQMSYPYWSYKCYSADDGFPVTPTQVKSVIDTADQLKDYAIGLLSVACLITALIGVNLLIYILNSKRVIKSKSARNFSFFRLIFTFVLTLISTGLLVKMIMDSDPQTLQYLSAN